MKLTRLFTLILCFCACTSPPPKVQSFKVEWHGALKNIMKKGDLSAKVDLAAYADTDNLYALGAIADLKGEILIVDSQPHHTYVQDEVMKVDSTYNLQATLLVAAVVADWTTHSIPDDVQDYEDLEKYIATVAKRNGIEVHQPFPFMIEGVAAELSWHVIDWPEGDMKHTHEKHIRSGLYGVLNNVAAQMLGFYSDAHHAVFTHHTTNMHIHMQLADRSKAGHVDDLVLGKGMVLKLPFDTHPIVPIIKHLNNQTSTSSIYNSTIQQFNNSTIQQFFHSPFTHS